MFVFRRSRNILPELERALDQPSALHQLFESREISLKKKHGRYCLNKPKSEFIIKQNEKYFGVRREGGKMKAIYHLGKTVNGSDSFLHCLLLSTAKAERTGSRQNIPLF